MTRSFEKVLSVAIFTFVSGVALADGCVIKGSDQAQLTIEEFADFECSYCQRGANTMKDILREYGEKIKLVFRNMPLSFHSHSETAAKAFAAVCLLNPKVAFEFQDELFTHQRRLEEKGEAFLYETAQKLGVDLLQLKDMMKGEAVAKSLAEDKKAAEKLGFRGTPSFLIGSEAVSGALPYADIKQIVDRQLAQ